MSPAGFLKSKRANVNSTLMVDRPKDGGPLAKERDASFNSSDQEFSFARQTTAATSTDLVDGLFEIVQESQEKAADSVECSEGENEDDQMVLKSSKFI